MMPGVGWRSAIAMRSVSSVKAVSGDRETAWPITRREKASRMAAR